MDVAELVENFQLFDDWEERYGYLIDLGRALPPFPDDARTPTHKVEGCLSQVWFIRQPTDDDTLAFDADSDSSIVRGLIAVIRTLYWGRTAADVAAVDIDDVFRQIGLQEHLTVNRRNGFYAMVGRVRHMATLL